MSAPDGAAPAPATQARGGRRAVRIGSAVLVLVLVAVAFYFWGTSSPSRPPTAARPSASPSASRTPTTAEIYTTVAPSVVSIDAVEPGKGGEFTGTGIVVNANGTVLTALHVVKGASRIRITFADGTVSDATIVADDPTMDIAALGPATLPSILVPAVLGGKLEVGDNVVAIGDQLGLTRSTTTGVVSGLDRGAKTPDGGSLSGLIQFDAAVNPGSSGGPLLDAKGETVGIVVALANPTDARTFIGIGFAVPIGAALAAGGGGGPAPQQ
ncbi:MAG TPA: trypsin-like peptidase domain-containing protein [Micromonosporaceae bacterium]|nr:trypsin-like peptidase domain-containing protein [Micromonosporaceae bacterium]